METDTMARRSGGGGDGNDPHLPRLASGDMGDRRDWAAWNAEMGGVARDRFQYTRFAGRQALAGADGSRWAIRDQNIRSDYMAMGPARLPETAARLAMHFMDIDQQDEAA